MNVDEVEKIIAQYHFHKISSATLSSHTLLCTFQLDPDPTSIFYTLSEGGKEPVREYSLDGFDGSVDVRVSPDGLGVFISSSGKEEEYISSEEIFSS